MKKFNCLNFYGSSVYNQCVWKKGNTGGAKLRRVFTPDSGKKHLTLSKSFKFLRGDQIFEKASIVFREGISIVVSFPSYLVWTRHGQIMASR